MYSIIPCTEKHDTVEENFSILEAPEARVTLQCDYADRYFLVADLLLNRRPWPYYIAPFVPLATTCSIVNIPGKYATDGSQQLIFYDRSEVTVNYTSKFQNLYSIELEPTTEFQQVDNKLFKWQSGGPLSEDTEVGFLRRGIIVSKTFYDVMDPLVGAILDYVGLVNSDTVFEPLLGFTFTPETLLYTPPHLSRTVRFDSTNAWQIGVKFMYKRPFPSEDANPGWNTFWNPSTQLHERMITKSNAFGSGSPSQPYLQYFKAPFTGVFF